MVRDYIPLLHAWARTPRAAEKKRHTITRDEAGQEIVVLDTSYASKNHQGGLTGGENSVSRGCIQEPSDVAAVKLLLSKLDPKSDRLFPIAKKEANRRRLVHGKSARQELDRRDETNFTEGRVEQDVYQPRCPGDLYYAAGRVRSGRTHHNGDFRAQICPKSDLLQQAH